MSLPQDRRRRQLKEARLNIVSKLYLRQYSYRQIRDEVMKRLELKAYSTFTVKTDIETLLAQWREDRVEDTDLLVQTELERIDETCRELWEQWEKSKEDYSSTTTNKKASISRDKETKQQTSTPYHYEESSRNVVGLGNVAYLSEIRQQLAERRKLLGLYAPEKKSVSGEVSFASLLVESGMLEEAERSAAQN